MLKILVFFLSSFLFPTIIFAQTLNWQWGNNGNCSTGDQANLIAHDQTNNLYVAGLFSGTLQLDTFILTSKGGNDVFIAKYANDGTLLWAKCGGSAAEEIINTIDVDSFGNVYVGGHFGLHVIYPNTTYDTAYFSNNLIVSHGNSDIFLVKYDIDGNIDWANDYGSIYNDDYNLHLKINHEQKLLLTGGFSNGGPPPESIAFGSYTINASSGSMFLVRMDNSSNVEIIKQYKAEGVSIDIDSVDNIYVCGNLGYNTYFDNIQVNSISSGFVMGDCFIAKFDSSMSAVWAKAIGGSNSWGSTVGSLGPISVKVSSNGNVYLLGFYKYCNLLVQGTVGVSLYFDYTFRPFFIKFSKYGQPQWIKALLGYSDFDAAESLYLDENQNVFLAGYFKYKGYFENDTLLSTGVEDAFIAKYDSLGTEQWAVNMGGNNTDEGIAITGTDDGSLYVSGLFYSSVFSYQGHSISNTGGSDMFVAKLSQTTGISNEPDQVKAEVFPNPTNETIYLKSKDAIASIKVYDITGKMVKEMKYETPTTNISLDVRGLTDGMYFMEATAKGKVPLMEKMVISH